MADNQLVHDCTIFLCSLDVRNIVQDGNPLYAGVNHKEGCGGHNLPKWVRFWQQKHLHIVWAQKFHFWAQGVLFSDLFVFSKFTVSFQNLLFSLHQ